MDLNIMAMTHDDDDGEDIDAPKHTSTSLGCFPSPTSLFGSSSPFCSFCENCHSPVPCLCLHWPFAMESISPFVRSTKLFGGPVTSFRYLKTILGDFRTGSASDWCALRGAL